MLWVLQAIDDVAGADGPPCVAMLDAVYDDPKWAQHNALPTAAKTLNESLYFTPMGGNSGTWIAPDKGDQVCHAVRDFLLSFAVVCVYYIAASYGICQYTMLSLFLSQIKFVQSDSQSKWLLIQ